MPSIITHALVGLAAARVVHPGRRTAGFLACVAALAMLPDADVLPPMLGLWGEGYSSHRGVSHSLAFAVGAGLLATVLFFPEERRRFGTAGWRLSLFFAAVMASHGVLDAFTDGGSGVEFLWPFDGTRFFAPWRPILVSPIGVGSFFGAWGLAVLGSEACWVWLPAGIVLAVAAAARRQFSRPMESR